MKYSICIDSCCRKIDSLDALDLVKKAGFEAYECWSWTTRDMEALKKKGDSLGLKLVTFSGKKAQLSIPSERDTWIEGLKETVALAVKLGNFHFTSTVGDDSGGRRDFQHNSIVRALKTAAPILEENKVTMFLEPLNGRINHIGTYLETSDEGFHMIE